MKTTRFFAALAATVVLASSCGDNSPFVKRSVFEQSEAERDKLQSSLSELQENIAKQNEDLCDILNELSAVNSKTSRIQLNIEGSDDQADQIALIHSDIQEIKIRIDQLESEANRARKLDKNMAIAQNTINELRETVTIQESRIAELTQVIAGKDATISEQQSTISEQDSRIASQESRIASQQEELKRTVARQVEMLYEAGEALEDIADNGDFKVTGRKNKISIKSYRQTIYENAAACYESALAQGHSQAQFRIAGIKAKIAALSE